MGELITKETNQAEIARMMVGREVLLRVNKTPAHPGPVVLHVEDLHALSDRNLEVLHGVGFDVHAGEILGIAGVEGNGQSELAEALTGMRKITKGKVTITPVKDGQAGMTRDLTTMNAREVRQFGLAHIPEDRRGSGLVLTDSIEDNTILGRQRWPQFSWRGLVLLLRNIAAWAKKLITEFDVRTWSLRNPRGVSILGPLSSSTAVSSKSAMLAKLCCWYQPSWTRFVRSPTVSPSCTRAGSLILCRQRQRKSNWVS